MECTDVCPHEPHLLLAGPDDLLAIAEGDLQREPVGDRREDSATLASTSVQKKATHPLGSSTSTTRITPPAGRHVATNVLYRFFARLP